MGFKDVFVLEVAENLNNFVQLLCNFIFLGLRYLALKLLVQERYEGFGRLLILLVYDVLEGKFDREVDLTVTCHSVRVDAKDGFPQSDQLIDELFDFELLIVHKPSTLVQDVLRQLLPQKLKRVRPAMKQRVKVLDLLHFVIPDH